VARIAPLPPDVDGLVRSARALLVEVTVLVERATHLGAESSYRTAEPTMAAAEARFAAAWRLLDEAVALRPPPTLPTAPLLPPTTLVLGRRRHRYFQMLPKFRFSLTRTQIAYDVNHPAIEHAFAVATALTAVA
jgi:hypothetical protein